MPLNARVCCACKALQCCWWWAFYFNIRRWPSFSLTPPHSHVSLLSFQKQHDHALPVDWNICFVFTLNIQKDTNKEALLSKKRFTNFSLVTFSEETAPQVCRVRSYCFRLCSLGLWQMHYSMYGFSVWYFLNLLVCDGLFTFNPGKCCWWQWYIFIYMSGYNRKFCQRSADVCLGMHLEV